MTKLKASTAPMARIVADSADATRDKFIPLTEATELYNQGKLVRVDIGPAYPNSFMKRT